MPGGFCVIPICASVVHSGLSLQGGVYPVVPIRGIYLKFFFFSVFFLIFLNKFLRFVVKL